MVQKLLNSGENKVLSLVKASMTKKIKDIKTKEDQDKFYAKNGIDVYINR